MYCRQYNLNNQIFCHNQYLRFMFGFISYSCSPENLFVNKILELFSDLKSNKLELLLWCGELRIQLKQVGSLRRHSVNLWPGTMD